jgi:hypothetical protein
LLVSANYRDLLKKMSLDNREIEKRLDEMRLETGFDPKSFSEVLHLKYGL